MNKRNQLVIACVLTSAVFGLALRADSLSPHDRDSAAEWAGIYWYRVPNSTMDYRLIILAKSRYRLILGGCFGSSELDHGDVTYRDGILKLHPRDPVESGFISTTLVPVRRDSGLYLVNAEYSFVRESGLELSAEL